jgi:hypothetical protein
MNVRQSEPEAINVTTAIVAIVAFLVGVVVGVILLISAQVRDVQQRQAAEPFKSTTELLSDAGAVDLGPGAPNHELFVQAKEDDRLRALNEKDEAK